MTWSVSSAPWRPLVRTLCATAGRSAAQRALPLYLGLWIVASVLLEGNGMRPAELVQSWLRSPADRALAYGVWTIVSLPAIRALLTAPSSFFLRTLPVPRWQVLTCLEAGMLLAELPWAYLWLRGGGLALGLAHVSAALAIATLLLTRLAHPRLALAAALLLLALVGPAPWPLLLLVSVPAAALGTRAVWLRAPEPVARRDHSWSAASPGAALAICHGLSLWRRARTQLLRSLTFTLLALLVSYFAIRNNRPGSDPALLTWALATLSPALLLAAASLAGPLLRSEDQLRWLLAVCGTPAATLRVARAAPLAAAGGVLASLHALALGTALALQPALRALLWWSALGAALLLAPLVLGIARWALRGDGNDSGRLVLGVGLALLGTSLALVWLGLAGLWLWAAAAALALVEPWNAGRSAGGLPTRMER